jgi:trehalose 6-phosphate synthase/phosphatase
MPTRADLTRIVEGLRAAPRLVLLLDYDGTLVPFAPVPEKATPDPALLDLLSRLAGRPATDVHLVSGRPRDVMDAWLGALPVWLHAEHGLWSRPPDGAWTSMPTPSLDWLGPARALLDEMRDRTPGSLVEEKTAGLAWHYRRVDPELGARRAHALAERLLELAHHEPVDVLTGEKVVEVRPRGIHKGVISDRITHDARPGTGILAMGDDRTDEDLFASLPAEGIAVRVGHAAPAGTHHVRDWRAARALLEGLLDGAGGNGGGTA